MKFKKQICIFMAFFLLVSNTGFSFNVHFCGDELASVSFKSNFKKPNSHKTCCAVIEKKESCCNDKVFNFHKNVEQLIIKSFVSQATVCVLNQELNSSIVTLLPNFKSKETTSYYCDAHAPPLFKLYQQYIFYDSI